MADRNGDGLVTLGELDRYLEDHVTAETAPQSQVPMVLGNKTEQLAKVNNAILASLQQSKAGKKPVFTSLEPKGIEEDVLARVDSSVRKMYADFKLAVQEKRFFDPADHCAEVYFNKLIPIEALSPLHGFMRRNYAAALQDDAQQVLNGLLSTEQSVITKSRVKKLKEYANYPRQLSRAAELLGENHYLYNTLMSRKKLFEGLLLQLSVTRAKDKESGKDVLPYFQESLRWQPNDPLSYFFISRVYNNYFRDLDSTEYLSLITKSVPPVCTKSVPLGKSKLVNVVELC